MTTAVPLTPRPGLGLRWGGTGAAAGLRLARRVLTGPVGQSLATLAPLAIKAKAAVIPAARRRSGLGALGWGVGGFAVAAWWLGSRLGWVELTALGVLGFFLLLAALCFLVGRSSYAVELHVAKRRVTVGEPVLGRVEVCNVSGRALLPAEVELPVGRGLAGFPLPRLKSGERHEDVFTVSTQHRSVVVVGPVLSVRGDPFGIARREVRWTDPIEVFVHPRTIALSGAATGFLKDLEGRPTPDLSPSDFSFHALREYVAGDDRRHVHWKTTARTGHLMVRQFEETRRSHLALALSTQESDYDDPEEFELAVSVAASLGLLALREERDLTFVLQGASVRGRSATNLLDDLARVAMAPRRGDLVTLARELEQAAPDASVAVLLFGAKVTPAQVRSAALRVPHGVRALAVRCAPGTPLSRRVIGDVPVVALGDLDDLPLALRTGE